MAETPAVREIQVWMPDGDKGRDNFMTLQAYIDLALRHDGVLPGSIARCKAYNKVLNQLSKVVVGLATYIAKQGYDVRDDDEPETMAEALALAISKSGAEESHRFAESLEFHVSETGDLIFSYDTGGETDNG